MADGGEGAAEPGPRPTLTACQEEAMRRVLSSSRSLLCVKAGPGSGKTTFLTELRARIVESDPRAKVQIVAYNKEAAGQFQARIAAAARQKTQTQSSQPDPKTFHALGLTILRNSGFSSSSIQINNNGDRARDWPDLNEACDAELASIARTAHGMGAGSRRLRDFVKHNAPSFRKRVLTMLTAARAYGWRPDKEPLGGLQISAAIEQMDLPEVSATEAEQALPVVRRALEWLVTSAMETGRIDFADMVWLPGFLDLVAPHSSPPATTEQPHQHRQHQRQRERAQHRNWLLVDEAQDMNGSMRRLVAGFVRAGHRVVAVADPDQSINGFMGAEPDALQLLRRDAFRGTLLVGPNTTTTNANDDLASFFIPLQETLRLPQSHVRLAQGHNPGLCALPSASEGTIRGALVPEMIVDAGRGDMIVCRLNAPLFSICIGLKRVRPDRPVFCTRGLPDPIARERSRPSKRLADILASLRRQSDAKEEELLAGLAALAAQQGRRRRRGLGEREADDGLLSRSRRLQLTREIQQLHDDALIVREFLGVGCQTVSEASDLLESRWTPECVTVSTVHRAKGREARRVWVVLQHEAIATPQGEFARPLEHMTEAERRVWYVAVTRAKSEMVFVTWDRPPHGGTFPWLEPFLPGPAIDLFAVPHDEAEEETTVEEGRRTWRAKCPICRARASAASADSATGEMMTADRSTQQRVFDCALDDGSCIICMSENADAVLVPCGHRCLCFGCFGRLATPFL